MTEKKNERGKNSSNVSWLVKVFGLVSKKDSSNSGAGVRFPFSSAEIGGTKKKKLFHGIKELHVKQVEGMIMGGLEGRKNYDRLYPRFKEEVGPRRVERL